MSVPSSGSQWHDGGSQQQWSAAQHPEHLNKIVPDTSRHHNERKDRLRESGLFILLHLVVGKGL